MTGVAFTGDEFTLWYYNTMKSYCVQCGSCTSIKTWDVKNDFYELGLQCSSDNDVNIKHQCILKSIINCFLHPLQRMRCMSAESVGW